MTTRAIKKLTKKDDLKNLAELNRNKIENSEESDEAEFCVQPKNKFNLLDELDQNDHDDESEPKNSAEEQTEDHESESAQKKMKNKSKTKKKKSKSKNIDPTDQLTEKETFDFVSTEIKEDPYDELSSFGTFFNNQDSNSTTTSSGNIKNTDRKYLNENIRNLFRIESKYLNSDNEMIRMFGAKIVQAERAAVSGRGNNRRNNKIMFKHNSLVNTKSTWPEFNKNGLSMKLVKEDDCFIEYTFEHNSDYQRIQFAFLDSVESLDHNNIINVLRIYPYHIDSLIQLSDVSRIHDDTAMAGDLIERALYAIQNSFHPSFNFTKTQANNNKLIKLDYNRVENRCFFIVLFKHIVYVGGKACYRTSLELCKLLLSLDIYGDPLAAILLLDFYAIKASQYDFLIDFYTLFNPSKHLNLLPNMSMSTALAYYYKYRQTSDLNYLEKANKLLEESLIKFPSILMELLDKCSVTPEKQVENNWIFSKVSHLNVPNGLKYLVGLYVTRMHYEWKIPENLDWLEKTVKDIISREKDLTKIINENKNKYKSLFSKVPPNLFRHLILSDLKEVPYSLPIEYSSTATYAFNPIPPKNSIVSYTRPARPQNNSTANASGAEALLTFFQSLLPSFNVQDFNNNRNNNQANEDDEGAVGGNNAGRFDMNQMINRLRDFLTSIEQHFPAAAPAPNNNNNNNQNNNNNNNEDEENEDNIREFD